MVVAPELSSHADGPPGRPPYRPPIGVPLERPERWAAPLSIIFHVLIVFLLVAPIFASRAIARMPLGAGGLGPAGGGGGGTGGRGGEPHLHERLHFVQVAPPASAPAVVAPRVSKPMPVAPPRIRPPPPVIARPAASTPVNIDSITSKLDLALAPGVGGGTGHDGTAGNGPGTGGGVGTGTGSGRGSGEGPGTGGGEGRIYPPTPAFLLIPPSPVPKSVKGRTVVVRFLVDERGGIQRVEFSSGDGAYDRQLREQLMEFRFRPAHKADGTPVAAPFEYSFTP